MLLALPVGPAAAQGTNWTGKTVLIKKAGVKYGYTGPKGEQLYYGVLRDLDYRVTGETPDGWVRVGQDGEYGWLDKANAVPVDDAVAHFTNALGAFALDDSAFARRGWAWKLKGELDLALKDLDEAVRLKPQEKTWRNYRGLVHLARKEFDQAAQDFDAAIQIDPKYAAAVCNRGAAWAGKRDYARALADFDAAIQLNGKSNQPLLARGALWQARGEIDKAVADYTAAIKLDPNDFQAHAARGLAWSLKREHDKAVLDFNQALHINPQFAAGFHARAVAWHAKGQYAKAAKDLDEAVRLSPKEPGFLNDLAWLLATCPDVQCRDGKRAVELAKRACDLTRNQVAKHLGTLGAAYAEAGQFDEAIRCQEEAFTVDPDYVLQYGAEARERLDLYKKKMPYREGN
jgi:tetratricopeptide (TPR) repeat protein